MKVKEIQDLTIPEIEERIAAEEDNLLHLKLNHSISPIENPMQIKMTRRTIARLKTILHQRNKSNQ